MAIDLENLQPEMVRDEEGVWHRCKLFVVRSCGGRTVIYCDEENREIKREALSLYLWRREKQPQERKKKSKRASQEEEQGAKDGD